MVLARWQAHIVDEAGNVQDGASVTVQREEAGSPLATLYSDRAGQTLAGNPLTADESGFVAFHAVGGAYRITATKGGFERVWRYEPVGLAQEADFLTTGVRYRFNSGTDDSDPGETFLKFNNAALASVTEIYISDIGESDADISTYLDTFDDGGETSDRGNLFIESGDGNGFILARVTGTVANDGSPSTYRTLTVTILASSGSFTENRVCSIQFNQAGGGLSSPVSLSDIQDIATARILGRDTAGSGVIEQLTLSQILDLIGPAAQGDILYRGASGWARLPADVAGRFLQTQGVDDDPQWAAIPSPVKAGTVQATTSGTAFDFTSLPSGTKRITIIFDGVSFDASDGILVQIGDSGGIVTTDYTSWSVTGTSGSKESSASGFRMFSHEAGRDTVGHMVLTRNTGNIWVSSHVAIRSDGSAAPFGAGRKVLSSELDKIRITSSGGSNFDAGQVNIFYE